MNKQTLIELDFSQQDLQLIRNWRVFNAKIKTFQNKVNPTLLKEILDVDENTAINLYQSHKKHRLDWNEFEKCLTGDWKDLILRYILKYCE